MTEREKIAQIVAEHLCPQGKEHMRLYGDDRRCYSRNNFAECAKVSNCVDALIEAGIGIKMKLKTLRYGGNKYTFCPAQITDVDTYVCRKQSDWLRCRSNPDGIVETEWRLHINLGARTITIYCSDREDMEKLYDEVIKMWESCGEQDKTC